MNDRTTRPEPAYHEAGVETGTGSPVAVGGSPTRTTKPLTIDGRPTVRQSMTRYYLAHCPTCNFGHVSKINMDGLLIRCECGTPFAVLGEMSDGE